MHFTIAKESLGMESLLQIINTIYLQMTESLTNEIHGLRFLWIRC